MKSRQRRTTVVVDIAKAKPVISDSLAAPPFVQENESSSARKLQAFGISIEDLLQRADEPIDELGDCYLIIQKSAISKLFETLICPDCKQPVLHFNISSFEKCGFAMKGQVSCGNCEETLSAAYLCERSEGPPHRMILLIQISGLPWHFWSTLRNRDSGADQ